MTDFWTAFLSGFFAFPGVAIMIYVALRLSGILIVEHGVEIVDRD